MFEKKVNSDRAHLHISIFFLLKDALNMRFKYTEGAELASLIHDGLNDGYSFKLLHGELIDRFYELVLCYIAETVLTVLAESTVFSEHTRVHQAL